MGRARDAGVMHSCPLKSELYSRREDAERSARDHARRRGLTDECFRVYECFKCKHWHITKAREYAAFFNEPRKWRKWDLVMEAELGTRVMAVGHGENMGRAHSRRHKIMQAGAAALRRRERRGVAQI